MSDKCQPENENLYLIRSSFLLSMKTYKSLRICYDSNTVPVKVHFCQTEHFPLDFEDPKAHTNTKQKRTG